MKLISETHRKKFKPSFFLLLLFFVPFSVAASPECQKEKLPHHGKVCFFPGEGTLKKHVLYYFHGAFGSQHDWAYRDIPTKIQSEWKRLHLGSPSVIAISYGRVWLATPPKFFGINADPSYLDKEELLQLESRLNLGQVQSRWIYGDSMGGHTAWQFALRYPELFNKVVSICSAQMSVSPFQKPKQLRTYAKITEGTFPAVLSVASMFRSSYKSEEIWDRESTMGLLKEFQPPQNTTYLIMTVMNDLFGFSPSNQEIYETLRIKGAKIDFFKEEGKHCHPPVREIVDFFVRDDAQSSKKDDL
jgi:pimeloyl-ACP methyl ester carboxylesterase